MDIEEMKIKVCDLIAGYENDPDTGVRAFNGR